MQRELGITVAEILKIPVFESVKVVAGERGLGRIVTNVNIMEVPDIFNWVREGDLLLTTAYAIRDDQAAQEQLVPQLAQKGLAGLGLKPRRYLETIPECMLAAAAANDFPLLEIPAQISFSDLIYPVLRQIVNKQASYLEQSLQTHRDFTNIVLSGGGLQEIADSLAKVLANTVYIADETNGRNVFAGVNWPREKMGELVRARPAGEGAGEAAGREPMEAQILESAASPFDWEVVRVREQEISRVTTPVLAGKRAHGQITVWATNRPVTVTDLITIERVTAIAALDIINKESVSQVERRYRSEFVDQILAGKDEQTGELVERGKFFGWNLHKDYLALLFDLHHTGSGTVSGNDKERKRQEWKGKVFQAIDRTCRNLGLEYILGSRSEGIVLLLCPGEEAAQASPADLEKRMLVIAGQVRREFNLPADWTVTGGIGRLYPGLAGIKKSYREARKALEIGRLINGEGQDIHFNRLGVYRLLYYVENREELDTFLQDTISGLVRYDQEKNSNLLATLEAYFACQGNVKKVSEQLFTHYNTVVYRLNRIQEIAGLDLANADDRLKLELACKLKKLGRPM